MKKTIPTPIVNPLLPKGRVEKEVPPTSPQKDEGKKSKKGKGVVKTPHPQVSNFKPAHQHLYGVDHLGKGKEDVISLVVPSRDSSSSRLTNYYDTLRDHEEEPRRHRFGNVSPRTRNEYDDDEEVREVEPLPP